MGWAALLSYGKGHWDSAWIWTTKPELERLRWDWEEEKTRKRGVHVSTSDLQARNKATLREAGNEGRTQHSHHVPTLDQLSNENNSRENAMCAFLINVYTCLKGKHGHWFVTTLTFLTQDLHFQTFKSLPNIRLSCFSIIYLQCIMF